MNEISPNIQPFWNAIVALFILASCFFEGRFSTEQTPKAFLMIAGMLTVYLGYMNKESFVIHPWNATIALILLVASGWIAHEIGDRKKRQWLRKMEAECQFKG